MKCLLFCLTEDFSCFVVRLVIILAMERADRQIASWKYDETNERKKRKWFTYYRPYHFSAPRYVPLDRLDLEGRYQTIGEAFMLYTTANGLRQLELSRGLR